MGESEVKHYSDSILYKIEQAAIYCRLNATQTLSKLNIGVTLEQYIALDTISINENMCQRDLSKIISKDRSNTGRILNILEEKKLIQRAVETKNNRLVKMIYITDLGRELLANSADKVKKELSFIYEYMSLEEFEQLRFLLDKLRINMMKNCSIQI